MKDDTTKSNMRLDGKMNSKDAGKAGVILAYGKSIALVIVALASLISAIAFLLYRIQLFA